MRFCAKSRRFREVRQRSRDRPNAQKGHSAQPAADYRFSSKYEDQPKSLLRGFTQAETGNRILLASLRGTKHRQIFFDTLANDVESFLLGFDRHLGQFAHIGKRGLESV